MKHPDYAKWITIALMVVGSSLSAFAYIDNKYVSKEVFSMVIDKLEKIETKLDKLSERRK